MICIISWQLKLKIDHPKIHKEFKNWCFWLKRIKKPFLKLPVDFTLQQTFNEDVAGQRIGIQKIMNSVSAHRRWTGSHDITLKYYIPYVWTAERDQKRRCREI